MADEFVRYSGYDRLNAEPHPATSAQHAAPATHGYFLREDHHPQADGRIADARFGHKFAFQTEPNATGPAPALEALHAKLNAVYLRLRLTTEQVEDFVGRAIGPGKPLPCVDAVDAVEAKSVTTADRLTGVSNAIDEAMMRLHHAVNRLNELA
jgi:hypothetical protein